jgi:hypothetical protein
MVKKLTVAIIVGVVITPCVVVLIHESLSSPAQCRSNDTGGKEISLTERNKVGDAEAASPSISLVTSTNPSRVAFDTNSTLRLSSELTFSMNSVTRPSSSVANSSNPTTHDSSEVTSPSTSGTGSVQNLTEHATSAVQSTSTRVSDFAYNREEHFYGSGSSGLEPSSVKDGEDKIASRETSSVPEEEREDVRASELEPQTVGSTPSENSSSTIKSSATSPRSGPRNIINTPMRNCGDGQKKDAFGLCRPIW